MAKNVEMKVEGNILTLKVDLSQDNGPSASGKTTVIGTTSGNVPVTDANGKVVSVGVNVYRK